MIDVVKEYLVSLGMQLDRKSFESAETAVEVLESGIKEFAGTAVKQFALAGTAIASFFATANVGIASLLSSLAKADLETEKFATQMWISKGAAAEINNTLKAMGATIEDLYLSPELLRNFQQLRATINDMKPPPEFQNQMKFIRSIQLEFQRMRLEATYALQWIGFYLFKYLEGPIRNVKKGMQGFNDAITKNMPRWTQSVAQFLSWFGRLGIAAVKGGRDIFELFSKLGDHIPEKLKVIGAALLALGLILKTGPFGIIFSVLTGILLLLDDFYTYLEGGESALGPLWKKLQEFFKLLKDTGVIDRLRESFARAFRKIEEWIRRGIDWLQQLFAKVQERGYLDNLEKAWSSTFGLLFEIIRGLWDWLSSFFDELNKDGILSGLIDSLVALNTTVLDAIGWVADLVSKFLEMEQVQTVLEGIGDFVSGTLRFALEGIKNTIDGITNGIKIAKAWLSGDDAGLQDALKEMEGIRSRQSDFAQHYGGKVKDFISYMFTDSNPPSLLQGTATVDKDTERLNTSINNLPRGLEPAFKKALNESEFIKGLRSYNQDIKSGLNMLAGAINPEVFDRYQAMSLGTYSSSYMYSSNSNQTIIRNENKPVFNITSTDPKLAAQEANSLWSSWSSMNIHNIRPVNG
ncbi:hypothetical protein [Brevibacillus sp. HD1.4A]|uniref:phage tail protein n=1 Tax=Brevibacillus sp. HD1.4A TaxID=2738978 RepID=UPI00156AB96F|nr:hypothetical protein [Brevibacillus sp. HD1.4A]NRQ51989.1 hypothetical protein [Brevibacillus sp. HD1.4A]